VKRGLEWHVSFSVSVSADRFRVSSPLRIKSLTELVNHSLAHAKARVVTEAHHPSFLLF